MGVVYLVRQVALDRVCALKMTHAGEHAGPERSSRFRTEVRALARLSHPNFVQIHETGEMDGRPYFLMEYVDGGSLAQAERRAAPDPAGRRGSSRSSPAPWASPTDAGSCIATSSRPTSC